MSIPKVPLDLITASDIARRRGDKELIRLLSRAISEVERQPCKFRCRTNREAFRSGAEYFRWHCMEHGQWPDGEKVRAAAREWRDE